ncbi:MAG: endonuclease MutS2 [Lachnospiraceae bacterium]|nr:endonuclease MutS2 [Lachnospiraceae bacterium]
MNQKALKTLEYTKIITLLSDHACSEGGKQLCLNLLPESEKETIETAQAETTAALIRIYKYGSISFSGVHDIRASLKRLEIGSSLNQEELLNVCTLLENTNRVKQYSRNEDSDGIPDIINHYFESLEPLTFLAGEIRRCIISLEEIADDASPELKNIRRNMRNINEKVHAQLVSMTSNSTTRSYLQEAVITQRNGRYCLPVKAEHRSQISGMIHDQSSSGSTFFIEPMAVVKLNNDLRELLLKEQEEIVKILSTLSASVAEHISEIIENYNHMVKLDFIFAKALFSKSYKGSEPEFNTQGIIHIKEGRHPLLDKHKVVPITIRLGEDFDLLVVTGPNTGGKTVSLKTTGLFTLMGQAGLHIPAADHSRLTIFEEVFADIGDEQSIEQSLSTFSAHMTNIVTILEQVSQRSLVLFDELGAGTDPTEGAALAAAILSHLHRQGIRTMATTHYSELKIFALSTDGVENACCEFDVETLRPTYRLLIGIPGKSNAFAISKKLGLPDYIIEDSKSRISQEAESFEDVITDLENSRRIIEKEQEEIRQYKEEIKELKQRLEKKQDNIDKRREDILRDANEKAREILADAKSYADQTMKDFRKFYEESGASKEMEKRRQAAKKKLDSVNSKLAMKNTAAPKKNQKPADFKVGTTVKVLSMGLEGTVSTLPNQKGDLYVQMGILRSQVNIKDLEILSQPAKQNETAGRTSTSKMKMSKSASISTEINLIGRTTDEAVALLDKYLDDAYLAHLPSVRVVHGKGTGALRTAVHKHLRRMKYVKSFRLGEFGEGDAGVTIVEFK